MFRLIRQWGNVLKQSTNFCTCAFYRNLTSDIREWIRAWKQMPRDARRATNNITRRYYIKSDGSYGKVQSDLFSPFFTICSIGQQLIAFSLIRTNTKFILNRRFIACRSGAWLFKFVLEKENARLRHVYFAVLPSKRGKKKKKKRCANLGIVSALICSFLKLFSFSYSSNKMDISDQSQCASRERKENAATFLSTKQTRDTKKKRKREKWSHFDAKVSLFLSFRWQCIIHWKI